MGRTISSFRGVLAMEKSEWKPFHNGLDKSERKMFDELFDIPRLYISACSNAIQLVPLQPIIMSILFHHYKELKVCINQVEQMQRDDAEPKLAAETRTIKHYRKEKALLLRILKLLKVKEPLIINNRALLCIGRLYLTLYPNPL